VNLQQVKQRFGIIGNSRKLNYALEKAIKVAPTDITVYIQGESGVGKESFSKIIHQLSHRKHGNFIAINCGAIPEGTINSELFGHEKGAFTGAIDTRKGYFETVDGGTIFLDEVGELPLETQSRLLRVLENGEFIKVGSSKVQKTDVRVITATNKDLLKESEQGKFREDLYYRLSTLPIQVPPLRERGDDVLILFRKFAQDVAEKYGKPEIELSPEAEVLLLRCRWPGNIRQLKNVTEQIAILENEEVIDGPTLASYLPADGRSSVPAVIDKSDQSSDLNERDIFYKVLFDLKNDMNDLKKIVLDMLQNNSSAEDIIADNKTIINRVLSPAQPEDSEYHTPAEFIVSQSDDESDDEEYDHVIIDSKDEVNLNENLSLEAKEEELIRKALLKNGGRRKKAAQDLGISERTLYRKIKQYGIEK
jgi:transcriptional regulator with GAF, ATPase, and Fis domain